MLIWKRNAIPADSVAHITTGAFIGEYYIEIVPGKSRKVLKSGDRIRTEVTVTPDELLQDMGNLLKGLNQSSKGINDLLGDPRMLAMIRDTIKSINDAARSAAKLTDAAEKMVSRTSPEVSRIIADAARAAAGASRISSELEDMLSNEVRPNMRSVFKNAADLMKHVDESVTQARELMAAYKGAGPGIDRTLAKAQKTLDTIDAASVQAQQMLTKLNEASSGIKDIATDPQVKADLKRTLHNAAEASEQAKTLVNTLNQKFGPKPAPSTLLKSQVPDYGFAVNALANTQERQSRVDAYYTFLGDKNQFYRVGAYSIGDNTGVIAQGGLVLNSANAFRYGVYDSQVGVGFDQRLGRTGLISLDWFRPNYGQFEARGTVRIGDAFGFYIGVNDLIHQQNRDLMVGLRYRK
jgi:phospholipid/cholesterol/gamma-HCH transport system substrate-binding protein